MLTAAWGYNSSEIALRTLLWWDRYWLVYMCVPVYDHAAIFIFIFCPKRIRWLCLTTLLSNIFLQFRTHKVIYRRYAGLFFSLCVDITDNELAYLECIHLFVEILDHFFSNVCELDLVFNFHKVCCFLWINFFVVNWKFCVLMSSSYSSECIA